MKIGDLYTREDKSCYIVMDMAHDSFGGSYVKTYLIYTSNRWVDNRSQSTDREFMSYTSTSYLESILERID